MTEQSYGDSIKFFSDWQKDPAKRTGLNVQHTLTRGEYPTVSIEIAPIRASGSSPDWKSKITVQLTRGELTAFCSVLFGLRSKAEGSYHGDSKNKGSSQKTESMVTPVFATPILTTSWLA
ncbi:hypothetical protein [Citrobacter freundii]|uniref:hypothetical protein n=1 Tax=Citrobacter freundii TaxID=546 RepID=UPI0038579A1D